jgi:PAS domain S-box-containing protein
MDISDAVAETILSTRSDAIIAADRDGIISFWNPGAGRLFGYSHDEAISRSLDLIIPERLRQRHWVGYRPRAVSTRPDVQFTFVSQTV